MAAAYVLLRQNQRALRRERVFRDRLHPLDTYDDQSLINRYRLPRTLILDVVDSVKNEIEHPTERSHAIPATLQVLTALRFYATGSFQSVAGDTHGISKASVSRCINMVSTAISSGMSGEVSFPTSEAERRVVIDDFYQLAEFPNVLGAVDGSLIPVKAPTENEHLFVCRKGYHAINIQGVCDAHLRFTNVVIKWPGSTHDAYMWTTCELSRLMEQQGGVHGWLLGDSGYPLRPWLLVPKMNAETRGDRRYNSKLKVTRCSIERCFGVWKCRFRCLHKSGGVLMYCPSRAIKIIKATVILHNICIKNRVPLTDTPLPEEDDNLTIQGPIERDGIAARDALIRRKFSY